MLPVFEVFGRTIGSYAVCSFVGLFVAVLVATRLSKSLKIDFEDIILMVLCICAGILIGGSLLYAITNIDKLICYIKLIVEKIKIDDFKFEYVKQLIAECFGGMVFYGGFIGASTIVYIYIKKSKTNYKKELSDIFAVCVPLFHTFGRIGCFLGGCCYGVESKVGFIANNSILPEMSGVRRFPVALLESLFNFLLFCFLCYLFKNKKKCGRLLFVYMLIYPVGRFVFEFFRGDEIRGIFLYLSTSQWISIILFVVGVVGIRKRGMM